MPYGDSGVSGPNAGVSDPPEPTTDNVLSACNFKGYLFDGEPACKCFPCFSGECILKSTHCSEFFS